MKSIIKTSLLAVASLAALCSCEEWITPQSVDIEVPTLESEDPELHKAYIQRLNAYKKGEHKVAMVSFANPAGSVSSVGQHITSVPDSVDYITLENPADLSSVVVADMAAVRAKGTKVIYEIDYRVLATEWMNIIKENPAKTLEEEAAYYTSRATDMLALCDKWNYDGVSVIYVGLAPVSMTEAAAAQYAVRQNAFMDPVKAWLASHTGKEFFFAGNPQYLIEANQPVLERAKYILLLTEMFKNTDAMDILAAEAAASEWVPSDRFVFRVHTTHYDDKDNVYGYLGSLGADGKPEFSIMGTAPWIGRPSTGIVRAGMQILGVQYDYFGSRYKITRQAISTMNPS